MTTWQPIETAPKDGTRIRLKRMHNRAVVSEGYGYFGDLTITHEGQTYVPATGGLAYAEPFTQTHRSVWVRSNGQHLFPAPTHWMPLSGEGQQEQNMDHPESLTLEQQIEQAIADMEQAMRLWTASISLQRSQRAHLSASQQSLIDMLHTCRDRIRALEEEKDALAAELQHWKDGMHRSS